MTTRTYFTQLNIILFAFIAGQLIFTGVAYYLNEFQDFSGSPESNAGLVDLFQFIVPAMAVGGVAMSTFLYRSRIEIAKAQESLYDKMMHYRGLFILRMALHEGPSLLSIVVYLLTGYLPFLAVAAGIIVLQFFMQTNPDKLIQELELKGDEKVTIRNESSVLT